MLVLETRASEQIAQNKQIKYVHTYSVSILARKAINTQSTSFTRTNLTGRTYCKSDQRQNLARPLNAKQLARTLTGFGQDIFQSLPDSADFFSAEFHKVLPGKT